MALPYINLYIGDIKKDTDLLSPCAFGAYVRLLFKMHEAPIRGEVSYTLGQLCKVFGADSLEQTGRILAELTDPANNVCTYSTDGERHTFISRRMKKETAISETRKAAGSKGGKKTWEQKTEQTGNFASDFAKANGEANTEANGLANNEAKPEQNYNNNIGINSNSKEEEKGVIGEKEETEKPVFPVPAMKLIWKQHKPKYVFREAIDEAPLRKIAEIIATEAGVNPYEFGSVAVISETWEAIVQFILTDNLYKDFQLTQVEKYFQSISSKFASSLEAPAATPGRPGKGSIIQNNLSSSNNAKAFLRSKQTA